MSPGETMSKRIPINNGVIFTGKKFNLTIEIKYKRNKEEDNDKAITYKDVEELSVINGKITERNTVSMSNH